MTSATFLMRMGRTPEQTRRESHLIAVPYCNTDGLTHMSETIFGDRLYQARMLRQRRLAELAELLNCSVPTMSKWEHSRTVEISSDQLSLLSENLRFSSRFFFSSPVPAACRQ